MVSQTPATPSSERCSSGSGSRRSMTPEAREEIMEQALDYLTAP